MLGWTDGLGEVRQRLGVRAIHSYCDPMRSYGGPNAYMFPFFACRFRRSKFDRGSMWLLLLCHGDPELSYSQLNREVKLLANLAPPNISGSSALQLAFPLII